MDLRLLLRFEIRDLVYFVALAEELHYTRAAERVGINQSPLSQAIILLEHRLRVRLFQRNRRRTVLTEIGAALLPHAKALLAEVDRLRKDIAAFAAASLVCSRTAKRRIPKSNSPSSIARSPSSCASYGRVRSMWASPVP